MSQAGIATHADQLVSETDDVQLSRLLFCRCDVPDLP